MTKGSPYALFLAESTVDALTGPKDDVVFVDELGVRGRTQTIRLWTLRSDAVLKEDWESEVAAKAEAPPADVPVS
jgi:class 3 adenylate cyclase